MFSKKSLYQKAATKGFTRDEVDALMEISKRLCAKVIKKYIEGLLEAKGAKVASIDASIEAPDFTGYQELTMGLSDGKDYTLRMQLSIVEIDYKIMINTETKYVKELTMHANKLIQLAKQFYIEFMTTTGAQMELEAAIGRPCGVLGHFGDTIGLDETYGKAISVLCYYVDANGRPIEGPLTPKLA
jgi:hypothetical protein